MFDRRESWLYRHLAIPALEPWSIVRSFVTFMEAVAMNNEGEPFIDWNSLLLRLVLAFLSF